VLGKENEGQLSNIPAGKEVRLVQLHQAPLKKNPELVSIRGKEVKPVQPNQAPPRSVPELVSICGKEVRPVQ
jgi:hypothetical protein